MSVNRKSFESDLHFNGDWQGSRVKDVMSNPENADIIAAAIGPSLLNHLTASAQAKPLYPKDLLIVRDAFMEAAGMETVDQPMGGTVLQRKPK